MMRRYAAYRLVEDDIDNNVDVVDGGDRCVLIRGEGSRLLLRICDYENE